MSTRQKGNRAENRFGDLLRERGYIPFYSRGSRGIDLIAIVADPAESGYGLPFLAVEIGRRGKAIAASFAALREAPKPAGTRVLVARYLRKKGVRNGWWRVHINEDTYLDDLDAALASLRDAA